jgi:hypothetical protein
MGSDAVLTEVVKAAPCPKVRAPACVPPAVIRVGFFSLRRSAGPCSLNRRWLRQPFVRAG